MIIALDGMGGDHAPGEIIAGALKVLLHLMIYIYIFMVMNRLWHLF